jgi:hypothetical protein
MLLTQISGLIMGSINIEHTIFCPPGPLPFKNASVNSASLTGGGRSGIFLAHGADEAAMPRGVIEPLMACSTTGLHLTQGTNPRIIVHLAASWSCCDQSSLNL